MSVTVRQTGGFISLLMLTTVLGCSQLGTQLPRSFPFPARADDLRVGEFWATEPHNQGTDAHDLWVIRGEPYGDLSPEGRGGPPNTSKNCDSYAYGRPIYAIADGSVVRCWRNAPEAEFGYIHSGFYDKTIRAMGNYLTVQLTTGECVRYSHLQPGTIPEALCPYDDTFTPVDDFRVQIVAKNQRPFVRKGQRIGFLGNSGNACKPHLHIHVNRSGINKEVADTCNSTSPLAFDSLLVREVDRPDEPWERLRNQALPATVVAIAPNFSDQLSEIVRYGIPSGDFQHYADQISGSGYVTSWIDGFGYGDGSLINGIFHRGTGARQRTFWGLDDDRYQQAFEQLRDQGLNLAQLDSYRRGDEIVHAAIFREDAPEVTAYHNRTLDEHQELFDDLKADGWRPVSISPTWLGGRRRFAAFYNREGGAFISNSILDLGDFEESHADNQTQGYRLRYFNSHTDGDDKPWLSAIWRTGPAAETVTELGLTRAAFQAKYDKRRSQGSKLLFVTGYSTGLSDRYSGHWELAEEERIGRWYISAGGTDSWREINRSDYQVDQLAFCDFDGDGRTDVFRADGGRWHVSSGGTGPWQHINSSKLGVDALRFADFDGDGKCDVFTTFQGGWHVSYGATGHWEKINTSQATVDQIRLGDFNGDGRSDVFTTFGGGWNVSYGGTNKWQRINTSDTTVDRVRLGDLNKDGKTDVFAAFNGGWNMSSSGTARWERINNSNVTVDDLQLADLNGDGYADVFSVFNGGWHVSYAGRTKWRLFARSKASLKELRFGDFDGNGTTDVFRWSETMPSLQVDTTEAVACKTTPSFQVDTTKAVACQ